MNNIVKRATRDENGAALILAIILLLVGGLIAAPLLAHMGTGILVGEVYETRTAELYAADAGVEDALWKIPNLGLCTGNPSTNYTIDGVNGKTVGVTIEYVDIGKANYRITSVATTDSDSKTTVKSLVFYGNEWGNLLDYGLLALDGMISLKGNNDVDSFPSSNQTRIYANGNIDISNNSNVWGNATATGNITNKDNVSGVAAENQTPLQFTLPDTSNYLEEAKNGGTAVGLTIESSQPLGPKYITGYLKVKSGATLTLLGTVWVDGYIDLEGGSVIQGTGPLVATGHVKVDGGAAPYQERMPVIISTQGNIDVGGSSTSYAVLYAPEGAISVGGSGAVNGAIVGKEVEVSVSGQIRTYYDTDVVARVRVNRTRILTWEVSQQP